MTRQTIGNPSITGTTVEEIRRSTQFWLQHVVDKLDELSGLRGASSFYGDVNMQGQRIRNVGEPVDPMDAVPAHSALTRALDPATGRTYWDAGNLQVFNMSSAVAGTDGVNLQQVRDEIATAGIGAVPYGTITMWYGTVGTVPAGWRVCDGTNGTPDLRDRFVVCAGTTYTQGTTGGAATFNVTSGTPSATVSVDNNGGGSVVNVGDETHTHNVTGSTIPPYAALVFIMKV